MVFEFYETIDSTNSEASRQLDFVSSVPGGFTGLTKKVIYAGSQSSGRGRLGRPFFSPDTGLYMSLIYETSSDKNFDPAVYTAAAAVAVCRSLKKLYGKDALIKWVNDIFIDGKKVCGILAEGKIDISTGRVGAVIVGIGINLFTAYENFPEEFRARAGSVLENGKNADIHLLCREISKVLFDIYDSPDKLPDVMAEYRSLSNLMGQKVMVAPVINKDAGRYEALVTDITPDARLEVQLENGEKRLLSSGEVSLHI